MQYVCLFYFSSLNFHVHVLPLFNWEKNSIHCDDEKRMEKNIEFELKTYALELHVAFFLFQIWVVMVCLHQMCCIAPWNAMKKDLPMDTVTVNVAAFAAIVDVRHECFDNFGCQTTFSNGYSTEYCILLKVPLSGRSFECAGINTRGWTIHFNTSVLLLKLKIKFC